MSAMLEDERFDGMLLSFAQQCHGIEPLLDTVFSFLRRKTDFFTGADPEVAKATILKVLDKHQSLAERTEAAKRSARETDGAKAKSAREAVARKADEEAKAAKAAKAAAAAKPKDVVEMSDDGAFDMAAAAPAPAADAPADADGAPAAKADVDLDAEAAKDDDDDKEPPPPGNGMVLDHYSWTQQLADLEVKVPVPPGTKSRDLVVDIRKSSLKVGLKGQPPILDGAMHKPVVVDDCMWTLEDGREVAIALQKEDKMNWWKCVMVGDPEINTQKVQPENSKLSDLDGETRMTVEKMMFDQRQKALGKPSADEMQKQEILEKFMKQHPEMDFSKAKMC